MPRVSSGSNDYGVLEVKCKREWFQNLFLLGQISTSFILKHNSITAYKLFISFHSNTQQLACKFGALQNSEVVGRTSDFGNWRK